MRGSWLAVALALASACTRAPAPPPDPSSAGPREAETASEAPTSSASAAPNEAEASASAASIAPEVRGRADEELSADVDRAAKEALERQDVRGAVVLVVVGGRVVHRKAYGLASVEPSASPMREDTLFDLASLTKPLATALSIMTLVERGKLRLSDPVARWLPEFEGKDVTIEHLLLHASGLPADNGLADYAGGENKAIARIGKLERKGPPGERFLYSDLGFILLGAIVERASGQSLDVFAREAIYAPLGLTTMGWKPSAELAARAAPTERDHGEMLKGRVHDPRAHALGDVAGHAGLFGTADDVAAIARMMLGRGEASGKRVLARATIERMLRPTKLEGGTRALGWDVDSSFSGCRGKLHGGYGHTGFTGTSLWIEPTSGAAVIVLTSRLHPDGKGTPMRLRREIADATAKRVVARDEQVKTGLDVLASEGFARLAGKTIGLLTNDASRDASGARTLDVLAQAKGVRIGALFSPEHGLGAREDGRVSDAKDGKTGLAVKSLYGEHRRPRDEDLAGLDALVVDLQDAGVRFYTYETTLGYVLEAAAKKHLEVIVLDRPNPLGGERVEGPLLDRERESFVGYHEVPVRHGMTLGELAKMFVAERSIDAKLSVVAMTGARRATTFESAGLTWRAPSPNLTSLTSAALYPGVALIELAKVSVGRGTDKPFALVGAPYVDGAALAERLAKTKLAGVTVRATRFTPKSSAFAGVACGGVELEVTDARALEPVTLGLALAVALKALYPKDFQASATLPLVGSLAVASAIERGDDPASIVRSFAADDLAFAKRRAPFLLYR